MMCQWDSIHWFPASWKASSTPAICPLNTWACGMWTSLILPHIIRKTIISYPTNCWHTVSHGDGLYQCWQVLWHATFTNWMGWSLSFLYGQKRDTVAHLLTYVINNGCHSNSGMHHLGRQHEHEQNGHGRCLRIRWWELSSYLMVK